MKPKVAIIIGSTRPSRISPTIATWAQTLLNSGIVQYDIVDLKTVQLPFLDEVEVPMVGEYQQAHTRSWQRLINSYQGIIFLFPQYNWGYPAVLKNAVDYLGAEWQNKSVSCITYGHHGGTQAYAAFLLVMNALKMRRLAVNPALTINPEMFADHAFLDIETAFQPYQFDLQLLKMNFERLLLKQS